MLARTVESGLEDQSPCSAVRFSRANCSPEPCSQRAQSATPLFAYSLSRHNEWVHEHPSPQDRGRCRACQCPPQLVEASESLKADMVRQRSCEHVRHCLPTRVGREAAHAFLPPLKDGRNYLSLWRNPICPRLPQSHRPCQPCHPHGTRSLAPHKLEGWGRS